MLMPKRVKWRKQMRGRMKGKALACRGQLRRVWSAGAGARLGDRPPDRSRPPDDRPRDEAPRQGLDPHFPGQAVYPQAPETRMGSGKGNVEYYVAVVKPGRIMFEVGGLDDATAIQALKNAQYKFSIKTKIVARHDAGEQA